MKKSYSLVIAIDGPSGSGKSSLAKELSKRLGVLYIDTGAMFRALAYMANQNKISFEEGPELKSFLDNITVEYGKNSDVLIAVDGMDLTEKIREHEVSKLASIISQIPSVREFLLNFQRDLARERLCVMEGRDIGTVVFPDAFSKFFVSASVEVRAKRRYEQLKSSGQSDVDLEQIMADVKKRDEKDTSRDVAPLVQADDAIAMENLDGGFEKTLDQMIDLISKRAQDLGIEL
jgi:cytidylate kinase